MHGIEGPDMRQGLEIRRQYHSFLPVFDPKPNARPVHVQVLPAGPILTSSILSPASLTNLDIFEGEETSPVHQRANRTAMRSTNPIRNDLTLASQFLVTRTPQAPILLARTVSVKTRSPITIRWRSEMGDGRDAKYRCMAAMLRCEGFKEECRKTGAPR